MVHKLQLQIQLLKLTHKQHANIIQNLMSENKLFVVYYGMVSLTVHFQLDILVIQ